MRKTAKVSVLATNYNNAPFLDDFFKSILNSELLPAELIFFDDGSTDDSKKIAKQYEKYPFVKLFFLSENMGRAAVLNSAKKHCTQKYTLLIDPDDIILPERIGLQVSFMDKHPEIDICGANVRYFNSDTGELLNRSFFPNKNIGKTYRKGENGLLQPTVIIKTGLLQKYEYKNIVPGQDYELFARMLKHGYKFANLSKTVNLMRIHPGSAVSSINQESISRIFDCRDAIFGTETSKFRRKTYFLYLKYYRKYALEKRLLLRYIYLSIASFFGFDKLISRIVQN